MGREALEILFVNLFLHGALLALSAEPAKCKEGELTRMEFCDTDLVEVTLSEEEYLRLPKEALQVLSLSVGYPGPEGFVFRMPGSRVRELMRHASPSEE